MALTFLQKVESKHCSEKEGEREVGREGERERPLFARVTSVGFKDV